MKFRAIVAFDAIVCHSQRILTGRLSGGSVSGRETELAPDQIRVVADARALSDTHLTVRSHDSIVHGRRYASKFVPVTRLAIGTKAKPDQDRHSGRPACLVSCRGTAVTAPAHPLSGPTDKQGVFRQWPEATTGRGKLPRNFFWQGSRLKCLHSGDVFTAIWGRFFSRYKQPFQDSLHLSGANMADKGRQAREFREHLPSPADAPIHERMEGKLVQSRMGRPKIRSDRSWHLLTLSWRTKFVLDQIEACSS